MEYKTDYLPLFTIITIIISYEKVRFALTDTETTLPTVNKSIQLNFLI